MEYMVHIFMVYVHKACNMWYISLRECLSVLVRGRSTVSCIYVRKYGGTQNHSYKYKTYSKVVGKYSCSHSVLTWRQYELHYNMHGHLSSNTEVNWMVSVKVSKWKLPKMQYLRHTLVLIYIYHIYAYYVYIYKLCGCLIHTVHCCFVSPERKRKKKKEQVKVNFAVNV